MSNAEKDRKEKKKSEANFHSGFRIQDSGFRIQDPNRSLVRRWENAAVQTAGSRNKKETHKEEKEEEEKKWGKGDRVNEEKANRARCRKRTRGRMGVRRERKGKE